MKNSEKMQAIFETLEQNHLNLYHSITKKEFKIEKDKVMQKIDDLDKIDFDYEMRKLFSLFHDAHTTYETDNISNFNVNYKIIQRKLYVVYMEDDKKIYDEVLGINSTPIYDIVKALSEIVYYETPAFQAHQVERYLCNLEALRMIGVVDKDNKLCRLVLKRGEKIKRKLLFPTRGYYNLFDSKPFAYENIGGVNYIKFGAFVENENASVKQFTEYLQSKDIKRGARVILDLRDNTGGNFTIMRPLFDFLDELQISSMDCLINKGTFSSGRLAAVLARRNYNCIFVGSESGSPLYCYGDKKKFTVDDCSVSYSVKKWDFTKLFYGEKGSIVPDIRVEENIDDIRRGIDRAKETALIHMGAMTKSHDKEASYEL